MGFEGLYWNDALLKDYKWNNLKITLGIFALDHNLDIFFMKDVFWTDTAVRFIASYIHC